VWTTLRSPGLGFGCTRVDFARGVVHADFKCPRDGSVGVVGGPVSPKVQKVLITPPDQPARPATIVDAGPLGRFFFMAFDWPVERVEIAVEPDDLRPRPFPFATNLWSALRRMRAEGVLVGQGASPDGRRWRLWVWQRDPSDRMLGLETSRSGAEWMIRSYGSTRRGQARLAQISSSGGGALIGELASRVAGVRVRLDDGSQIDAEILRTDAFDDDYWIAFTGSGHHVIAIIALDQTGQPFYEDTRPGEALKRLRDRHGQEPNSRS
jgi:hypothetical protein